MSHPRTLSAPASPALVVSRLLQLPLVVLALALYALPAIAQEQPDAAAMPEGAAAAEGTAEAQPDSTAGKAAGTATPRTASRDAADLEWEIEGYLTLWAESRWAGGDSSVNMFLDVLTDARRGGDVPLHARVNGRLVWNLTDNSSTDPLYDVWDTFDGAMQVRMYEAYFEAGKLADGLLNVRAGRQFLDEGIWLHYDGVRADLDFRGSLEDLDLSILGGLPVKFGETSRNDSWLAGIVARYRLAEATRLRLEYYHVSEQFDGINDPVVDPPSQPVSIPAGSLDDDYLGLTAWHAVNRTLNFYGRFTLLNGDANEFQVRVRWRTDDANWLVVGEYYQLFGRLTNVTNDLTPFVPMLGSYQPFVRVGVTATHRIEELWVVQLGVSHRELLDDDDEGLYNHEYNQGTISATRLGLLDGRLDATLIAQGYWTSDNDFAVAGGHVDYRLDRQWTITGGIDFSYYKYDYQLDTERENVWTFSVEGRYKINARTTARARLAVSEDDFETWTTLDLRLSLRF